MCAGKEPTSSLLRARWCLELSTAVGARSHASCHKAHVPMPAASRPVQGQPEESGVVTREPGDRKGAWMRAEKAPTSQESKANSKGPKWCRGCARDDIKRTLTAARSAVPMLPVSPVPHRQQSNSVIDSS